MDFLDPRKKRSHSIRLMIGYFLMAIAIGLGTIILVYSAYGYGIDTKTGQITENGLLFVDSKPGGADIYLNGKNQNATSASRLILPSGDYFLKLQKAGYRTWSRHFTLIEHQVARYVYPFLFPTKLNPLAYKTYPSNPSVVTESPDRHWLLVGLQNSKTIDFDVYDTGDVKKAPTTVSLPAGVLTNPAATSSSLSEVEWSTDNDHVLLLHKYQDASEYIVLSRTAPETSFNVNKMFGINPLQVALHDKKIDQLYIHDANHDVRLGDTGKQALQPLILSHVLAFKPNGSNLIAYVTDTGAQAGKATARVWDNGKIYPITSFPVGNKYLIDFAQFQSHWYYIVGSDTDSRVNVYKDPIDSIRDPGIAKAVPMFAFSVTGGTDVSFSANARFVGIQAAQKFGVYDFEVQTKYEYEAIFQLNAPMQWMDGHRWIGTSNGQIVVMDFDSTNPQTLSPTSLAVNGFFSRDYNQMFTTAPVAGAETVALQHIDMRAGTDLP